MRYCTWAPKCEYNHIHVASFLCHCDTRASSYNWIVTHWVESNRIVSHDYSHHSPVFSPEFLLQWLLRPCLWRKAGMAHSSSATRCENESLGFWTEPELRSFVINVQIDFIISFALCESGANINTDVCSGVFRLVTTVFPAKSSSGRKCGLMWFLISVVFKWKCLILT